MTRLLAPLVAAIVAAAQTPPGADGLLAELGRITGLSPKRAIRYDRISRDRLKQLLEERVRKEVKPEQIRLEELVLKKLGFVPLDFDLKKNTIELMTEQAAAFYDFHGKRLFLLDAPPASAEEPVLFHELSHAVTDQHFRLARFLDAAESDDDGTLARMAVMEGQATWLMSEFLARRLGRSLKDAPELVEAMRKAVGGSGGQFPVFESAPLYMRESLVFPYSEGMALQHAVYLKLGQAAFTELFRHPPASTQQVLHPDKYFARAAPGKPKPPEPPGRRSWRLVAEGNLGEFDHSILLRQYAGEGQAASLAPKWTGDAYRLYEHKRERRAALSYVSCWESQAASAEFFAAWRLLLRGKWKTYTVSAESATLLTGQGDDGRFRARLEGMCVTSLQGMADVDEPAAAR